MNFKDVFPYDHRDYSQVIYYFEECINGNFPKIIDEFVNCCQYRFDSCGLNLPSSEDNFMVKGPFAWSGDPFLTRELSDYDHIDFKMFIVCFQLAAEVYLFNNKECKFKEQINNSMKILKRNYTDISWIIEKFYGIEYYVCDDQAICTGEHHGKEWGERWYEEYGKYLNFDDIDDIVETQLRAYFEKQK